MTFLIWLGNIFTIAIPQLLNTLLEFILDLLRSRKRKEAKKVFSGTDSTKREDTVRSEENLKRRVEKDEATHTRERKTMNSATTQKKNKAETAPGKKRKGKSRYYTTDEDIDKLSIDDPDYLNKMALYLAGDRSLDKIQLRDKE